MKVASRLNSIASCLATLLLVFAWIPAAAAADILFVADVPLNAADQSIVDYVRAKGHHVVVIDDAAAVPDTTSTELIMISESVDPAEVGTKYNDLPVRILVWDDEMQYVLGMTGPTVETDFGYSSDDVRAHLVDHNHPLAGGLTGNDLVVFTGTAKPMGWGEPNNNADVVARQVLAGKRPLLYEYAPGAKMVNGKNAPSNRIFFFMADNGIFGMTDSGKAFLDAILGYSITGGDFTAPVIVPPANMLVEADTLNGAIVNYPPATVTDNKDPNPTVTYSQPSGTLFPMGVTTVTIIAEDNVGNQSTATFTITVKDTTPPTIGGGNIVNGNLTAEATSAAGAVVTFVGATDLLDPNPTIDASPPSGSTFPLGVTTVNVIATDSSNNTASGSFTVTVVDTTPPAITPPANMVVEATITSGALVSYPDATVTDAVTANPVVNYSRASGSAFALGVTTVTITATDAAGNAASASFTVTVQDTTPPTIGGGSIVNGNLTVEATGPNGAIANYVGATDLADPNPTVVCNPPSGSLFPLGVTTVNVTATDAAGNSASGSFTVTVVDTTGPVFDSVPPNQVVEANTTGGAIVNYPPATAHDAVSNPVITYSQNSGTLFPLGVTVVTATATDNAGNATTAGFTITVQDTTPPVIGPGTGSDGNIVNGNLIVEATGPDGAIVNFIGATDLADANPAIIADPPSGSLFPLGVTTVNVTATDASGNSASGSFTITVVDTTKPVFDFVPPDQIVEANTFGGAIVSFPPATAHDAVTPNLVISYSQDSGTFYPLGATIVTVTVSDDAGNTSTASFTITVQDTTPPVIGPGIGSDGNIVNGNLIVEATGPDGAIVNFIGATDLADASPTIIADPPSGSQFPIGSTTVQVAAMDASGNSATGSFTVTVVDTTPPSFTSIPSDKTVEATTPTGDVVNYPQATATDLTSTPTITYSNPSGSFFNLGETLVTVTATDAFNNSVNATFKVTVTPDVTPPTIVPPTNVTTEATGNGGAVVTYPPADTGDATNVNYDHPSGDTFPVGTTTVTVTATDDSGNTSTSAFTVTVTDTTVPIIVSELTSDPSEGTVGVPVVFTIVATDAQPLTYTWDFGDGTTQTTTEGTVTHTYEVPGSYSMTVVVSDPSGNSTGAGMVFPVTPADNPTAARIKVPMLITRLLGGALFNKKGADRFSIAGFIPNSSTTFSPFDRTITLDVGGALATFKLDAKGRSKTPSGRLMLKLKYKRNRITKKKEFVGGAIPFVARLSKGTWVPKWQNYGVNPERTVKRGSVQMVVDLTLSETIYTSGPICRYDAKAKKSGSFRYVYRKPRK